MKTDPYLEPPVCMTSPRGEKLARRVRDRDLAEAREREKRVRERRAREDEARKAALHRSRTGRARVELREGQGERYLVFRGPHTDADLWIITGILAPTIVIPVWVGLLFLHWAVSLLAIALTVGAWLLYVYSPVLVTVTNNGFFEAKRPGLPTRDVGRFEELELDVSVERDSAGGFSRRGDIDSKRWKLFTVHRLSPDDEALIEEFRRGPTVRAEAGPHDGGYRRAA